jgi:predicted transcriptional regulator of viral defense system
MEFERLLELVGDEPVFETALLLAGDVDPALIYLQLSRWTSTGRVYQLRRGVYTLAPPFQKVKPHPYLVANRMVRASYVSCQSALAYHGLIPEYVPVTVSVTTARPASWDTPLGVYRFRHIKPDLFQGYRRSEVADRQYAFIAEPEKALLDLMYLTPGSDSPAYLRELRLKNMDTLDVDEFHRQTELFGSPKLKRAANTVLDLAVLQDQSYEIL